MERNITKLFKKETIERSFNKIKITLASSDKIKSCLGFEPKHTIDEAVRDLCEAFKKDLLPNSFEDDKYFNVQRLKRMHIK